MLPILKKLYIPGAFYNITFNDQVVIKQQRNDYALLFFNLFFINPSLQNFREIIFHPQEKVLKIKSMFAMERNIVEHIPSRLIGNVVFIEHGYIQKRVEVFKNISINNDLYIKNFKKWINSIKELWTYGYHDQSMNFDVNSGFDEDGECILFDFNEFTNDFNVALNEVQNKKWYKQHPFWKLRFVGNQGLRLQILEIIDREFTEENLKKLWGMNRKTI